MSSKIADMTGQERNFNNVTEMIDDLQKEAGTAHSGGGGGGNMLERVAKLEAGVAHLQGDVTDLRDDMKQVRDRLATLQERVSHLPTRGQIRTDLLLLLALVAALVTFQDHISSFVTPAPEAVSLD